MLREFRQLKKNGKWKVWRMWRDEGSNKVGSEHGWLNGAMTPTEQTFSAVNIGKKNEESPEEVAQKWMDKEIRLRVRRGYKEVNPTTGEFLHGNLVETDKETVLHGDEIRFDQPLPQNMRPWKPLNAMNPYSEKGIAAGTAWAVRKRNGNMCVVTLDDDREPRMYSSTLAPCPKDEPGTPWMDRFPHLEEELRALNFQPGTILLCELVADVNDDNLEYVGSVMRALTRKAIDTQDDQRPLCLCIWDIAYHGHTQLAGYLPYQDRRTIVDSYVYDQPGSLLKQPHILEPEIIKFDAPSEGNREWALKLAIENGWEGYVIVDPTATFGDKAIAFQGKAERPKEAAKLKPKYECDFIVRWDPDNKIGTWGKGKKSVGVGAVFAYLLDEKGEEVFISKVGGGLTDEDVRRFADPSLYPMVWEVAFATVTTKGSLEFPEFIRVRDDKQMNECTLDNLADPRRKAS